MNAKFKETINDKEKMEIYTHAAVLLIRCTGVLAHHGADLEAISLFIEGVNKLQLQLKDAIQAEGISDEVSQLLKGLGIKEQQEGI